MEQSDAQDILIIITHTHTHTFKWQSDNHTQMAREGCGEDAEEKEGIERDRRRLYFIFWRMN